MVCWPARIRSAGTRGRGSHTWSCDAARCRAVSVLAGAALASASLLVPIAVRPARAQRRRRGATTRSPTGSSIAPDGEVTLGLSQPEVGQGSYTALPQILADELDADWARVKVRFVTGRPAYKIAFRQEAPAQKEGASMSTTALYTRLRTAGAAARDVLVRAAAQRWSIDVSQCRTENGHRHQRARRDAVLRRACRRRRQAAAQRRAAAQGRRQFHLIGKPVARLDTPAKCNGSAVFGIDVVVPGMLNAAIKTARVLHRAGDRDQERGRHSQDAGRARGGEDRRRWRSPTRTPAAQHPQRPHCRGTTRSASSPIILAGQARGRCARRGVRRRHRRRSLDRQDRRHAGRGLDAEHGVTALLEGPAAGNPAGARGVGDRAALRAAAHRACAAWSRSMRPRATRTARSRSGDRSKR